MADQMDRQPRHGQKCSRNTNQTERSFQLLFLSFGVLCIIQAILNVSVRLALNPKESTLLESNTSTSHGQNQKKEEEIDCGQKRPQHCNTLQEKFNALTRDVNLLENRNNELNNMIKFVEEERDRLKMKLEDLSGCMSSQRCPTGWREINSRCYFFSNITKTWQESRTYCQSKGADLVVINNEEEQRALYRLDGEDSVFTWIGLSMRRGIFTWVDGSALTLPFWKAGQPDEVGPNIREKCVVMDHFDHVLANWNDTPCKHKRHWVCESDPK